MRITNSFKYKIYLKDINILNRIKLKQKLGPEIKNKNAQKLVLRKIFNSRFKI